MANTYSYRYGQRELVKGAVDSAIVVEIGDMVFLNTDDVRPATSFTWDDGAGGSLSDLDGTQALFAAQFLGVAAEASASGQTDPISVDISPLSVYEFSVASATYEIGGTLAPDKTVGADTLQDQQLEAADQNSSIAMAKRRHTSATTKLHVSFASAYNPAANNANSALG